MDERNCQLLKFLNITVTKHRRYLFKIIGVYLQYTSLETEQPAVKVPYRKVKQKTNTKGESL